MASGRPPRGPRPRASLLDRLRGRRDLRYLQGFPPPPLLLPLGATPSAGITTNIATTNAVTAIAVTSCGCVRIHVPTRLRVCMAIDDRCGGCTRRVFAGYHLSR